MYLFTITLLYKYVLHLEIDREFGSAELRPKFLINSKRNHLAHNHSSLISLGTSHSPEKRGFY